MVRVCTREVVYVKIKDFRYKSVEIGNLVRSRNSCHCTNYSLIWNVFVFLLFQTEKNRRVTLSFRCIIVDAHKAQFYSVRYEIFDTNHTW